MPSGRIMIQIESSNMTDSTFPGCHKAELISQFLRGPDPLVEFIQGFEDPDSRRQLYTLAQRTFGRDEHRDLDALIVVVRAGIEEGLRQSGAEADGDLADKCKNYSNVLSYNLSADLAECWPEDSLPREKRHFEAGLTAAHDCLRWRKELQKGPYPFSIAWWARGIHEMSLGRFADAADSFDKALDFGIQSTQAVAHKHDVDTDFNVVLNRGYAGLARRLSGIPEGEIQFIDSCDRFGTIARTASGDTKNDAEFGLAQLRCAALATSRLQPSSPPPRGRWPARNPPG